MIDYKVQKTFGILTRQRILYTVKSEYLALKLLYVLHTPI